MDVAQTEQHNVGFTNIFQLSVTGCNECIENLLRLSVFCEWSFREWSRL